MINIEHDREVWEGIDAETATPELINLMCSMALVYLAELERLGAGLEKSKKRHPARLRSVE